MSVNNLCRRLAVATGLALLSTTSWAITSYQQDHEGLDASDGFALGFVGGENYGIFADVWFGDVGTGTFLYNYGVFTAPNGGAGFSAIAGGEGGVNQGSQYLNIYSDYGNVDHGNSFNINTNVFQEFTIGAGNIGETWTFEADFKAPSSCGIGNSSNSLGENSGNSCGPDGIPGTGDDILGNNSQASAFIKTLDPGAGFATTNDIRFFTDAEIANIGNTDDWGSFSISIDLTAPELEGQLIQFGFNTVATDYHDSGAYYDNVCWNNSGGNCEFAAPVPVPAAVWLFGSAIGLLGFVRRRMTS